MKMNVKGLLIALSALLTAFSVSICVAADTARFDGRLVVEVLADGRNLRTVEPFSYIDPKGVKWDVPGRTETDGASVPRVFWTLAPPFSGKHRFAAVVHDYYCQTRTRPWRDVHRVFYDAMRTAGVARGLADLMYAAVYGFGPRWSMISATRSISFPELPVDEQRKALQALQGWIQTDKPTPEQIEHRINETRMRDLGVKLVN